MPQLPKDVSLSAQGPLHCTSALQHISSLMFGATIYHNGPKFECWCFPAVPFPTRAGSLDGFVDALVDAPASYSSAQKISWAPAHEFLYSVPMFLYTFLCFPAGILHWVVFPFHQVLKILLSPGLLTCSLT
jgi:hypothetical protein